MAVEVAGAGTVGLAFETTLGTFQAPTKWVRVRSESLQLQEDKIWRRNIRGKADITGAVKGYLHVEGDVVFEVTSDTLVYFLYAGRFTPAKTGSGAPYTYTFTPTHVAKTTTASGTNTRKTLSLLVNRSDNPMGYVGLSVSQYAFTIDNGLIICTASLIGTGEGAQSAGTPSFTADDPYGPGEVTLEFPTGTPRSDVDNFTLTHNDNGVAQFRLNGTRTAAYVNWGEREITASYEADFDALTDFNAFTAQTQQTLRLKGVNTVGVDSVQVDLAAVIEESYAAGLSGLGDVVRGAVAMHGIYDTSDAATYTIITSESIT